MDTLLLLARAFHLGGAMILVALPFSAWRIAGRALLLERPALAASWWRLAWAAWIFEVVSGVAWLWIVAGQMSGESPLADSSVIPTVLGQTAFGRLWIGRAAVALALGLALALKGRRIFVTRGLAPTFLLAVALLVSLAWAGHAASGIHDRVLHLAVDLTHLLAGAVWPVGLLPLALILRGPEIGPAARQAARRFSRAAGWAVLVMVGTGVANSLLMIGSWAGLFGTAYGRLLLAKMALVLAALALGWINRQRLLPRGDDRSFRTLRRLVWIESLLAAAILFLVGAMGMTAPPSSAS